MTATDRDWFLPLARYLGPAYLRNAFTKGTVQEVDFLMDTVGVQTGDRVLDVGCGPGRHTNELARRGLRATGVDLSDDFLALARRDTPVSSQFVRADVRHLPLRPGSFDVVVCLCQGGFGLLGGRDESATFAEIAQQVRPGGALVLSVFSSAFAIRHLEHGEQFDVATGVLHERATLRNEAGEETEHDLWTTCMTSRELELLARGQRLEVVGIYGATPGRYCSEGPTLDHPELLLVAKKPEPGFQPAPSDR